MRMNIDTMTYFGHVDEFVPQKADRHKWQVRGDEASYCLVGVESGFYFNSLFSPHITNALFTASDTNMVSDVKNNSHNDR